MHLKNISLLNFKNITEANFDFSERVNCFLGNNGQGKTNVLDAIHHLSYTKSYFNSIDSQNIKFETPFYVIQGEVSQEDDIFSLYCGLKKGDKKIFKKNKKNYSRLADHIGLFPVVMITPYDINLVLDGSETRRKFIDALISQFNKNYLNELIQYNKLIQQRNSILKGMKGSSSINDLLDIYEIQIVEKSKIIFEKRNSFIEEFVPIFNKYYQDISAGKEDVDLIYSSSLHEHSMEELLKINYDKDRMLTYTSAGVHRDDLQFMINGFPIKKFGSQGQQKTFLIALKLAKFEYITLKKGFKPILLLDDIFDKLDNDRVGYILKLIEKGDVGQTFITDTDVNKVPEILNTFNVNFNKFIIENGEIKN